MSNLAKQKIRIPKNITVKIINNELQLKGPLGSLEIPLKVKVFIEENNIIVSSKLISGDIQADGLLESKALQGTFISLIKQSFTGLISGFRKRLNLVGVGYKAQLIKNILELKIGYSHVCGVKVPSTLKIFCPKPTSISIFGINKQEVNNFAAFIRSYKVPEPYKGKGILYQDEKIILKEGKRS
jgi:large subunit ribosomal protein L6